MTNGLTLTMDAEGRSVNGLALVDEADRPLGMEASTIVVRDGIFDTDFPEDQCFIDTTADVVFGKRVCVAAPGAAPGERKRTWIAATGPSAGGMGIFSESAGGTAGGALLTVGPTGVAVRADKTIAAPGGFVGDGSRISGVRIESVEQISGEDLVSGTRTEGVATGATAIALAGATGRVYLGFMNEGAVREHALGSVLQTLTGPAGFGKSVAVSDDGTTLAVCHDEGMHVFVDGVLRGEVAIPGTEILVAVAAENPAICAVASGSHYATYRIDRESVFPPEVHEIPTCSGDLDVPITGMSLDPAGTRLALCHSANRTRVVRIADGVTSDQVHTEPSVDIAITETTAYRATTYRAMAHPIAADGSLGPPTYFETSALDANDYQPFRIAASRERLVLALPNAPGAVAQAPPTFPDAALPERPESVKLTVAYSSQLFVVPDGVSQIAVALVQPGTDSSGGALVYGDINVTPGEVLELNVTADNATVTRAGQVVAPDQSMTYRPGTVSAVSYVGGPGRTIRSVAGSLNFAVAVLDGGDTLAWGNDAAAQGYVPAMTTTTTTAGTGVVAAAASMSFGLLVRADGTLWFAGQDSYGWSGTNTGAGVKNPAQQVVMPGGAGVANVACSAYHTLALGTDGTAYAWGSNYYGQLGTGTSGNGTQLYAPAAVGLPAPVRQVAAGAYQSYFLAEDGQVFVVGRNTNGELGVGTQTPFESMPQAVPGLSGVRKLAVGSSHVIALLDDGSMQGWGYGYYGQLGNWSNATSPAPVGVMLMAPAPAIDVAATSNASFAVTGDGSLYAWGRGYYGIGLEFTANYNVPQRVPGIDSATAVFAAGETVFVLLAEGTVKAFGYNAYGQVRGEAGGTANQTLPVYSFIGDLYVGTYGASGTWEDGSAHPWTDAGGPSEGGAVALAYAPPVDYDNGRALVFRHGALGTRYTTLTPPGGATDTAFGNLVAVSGRDVATADAAGGLQMHVNVSHVAKEVSRQLAGLGGAAVPTVVDSVASSSPTLALSANQGRLLRTDVDTKADAEHVHSAEDITSGSLAAARLPGWSAAWGAGVLRYDPAGQSLSTADRAEDILPADARLRGRTACDRLAVAAAPDPASAGSAPVLDPAAARAALLALPLRDAPGGSCVYVPPGDLAALLETHPLLRGALGGYDVDGRVDVLALLSLIVGALRAS